MMATERETTAPKEKSERTRMGGRVEARASTRRSGKASSRWGAGMTSELRLGDFWTQAEGQKGPGTGHLAGEWLLRKACERWQGQLSHGKELRFPSRPVGSHRGFYAREQRALSYLFRRSSGSP